ncbi:MAG: sugar phosphate isomerase/epimerase [Asgard group archaeon]|nr:sugar phosphate isomerase/epimerase [Asgard group archaeon]
MKIGMTFEPFRGVSIKKILFLLRVVGLDHLEINPTILHRFDEFIPGLKKTTTTFHLPLYSRFHYDIGSTEKEFQNSIEKTITFLNDYKNQLNLQYVLTHPPEDPSTTTDSLINRLEKINTQILIENIMGQSDEDFMEFYFEVKDRLGKKLAGHAIDGPHRYVNNNANWLEIPDELLKEIAYVHISDCTKKADLHQPLGCAKLPFNEFFSKLKEINYKGVILQEIIPTFDQIASVLDSFLYSVKPFSKTRYLKMKMKFAILKPFTQMKIRSTYKRIMRDHSILLQDLAYDLGL